MSLQSGIIPITFPTTTGPGPWTDSNLGAFSDAVTLIAFETSAPGTWVGAFIVEITLDGTHAATSLPNSGTISSLTQAMAILSPFKALRINVQATNGVAVTCQAIGRSTSFPGGR